MHNFEASACDTVMSAARDGPNAASVAMRNADSSEYRWITIGPSLTDPL